MTNILLQTAEIYRKLREEKAQLSEKHRELTEEASEILDAIHAKEYELMTASQALLKAASESKGDN